jgi:hypothetical protein
VNNSRYLSGEERVFTEISALIGTISKCGQCKPQNTLLGNYSPKKEIRNSGFWLVQHLKSNEISGENKNIFLEAIQSSKSWFEGVNH